MRPSVLKNVKVQFFFKSVEVLRNLLGVIVRYCRVRNYNFNLFSSNKIKMYCLNKNYKSRFHTFCTVSGRSRGVLTYFGVSRIVFRELGSRGFYFGMCKSSW